MKSAPWYNGLRVQILLFLALALFPLGAVAIYQTQQVTTTASRNGELALLAVTGRAAKSEEAIIERAFGAARFFATVIPEYVNNPARCAKDLGQFVRNNPKYSFVGVLPKSGVTVCTSTGEAVDVSGWQDVDDMMDGQKATIVINTNSASAGSYDFIVSEPYEVDGAFAGFISISIPHSGMPDTPDRLTDLGLEEIVTFNADGAILTARSSITKAEVELPTRSLTELRTSGVSTFQGKNQLDERRTYTLVPIEGSPATVLGIWRASDGLASDTVAWVRPSIFPLLMWLAGMSVAMLSLYRLVLKPIQILRSNIDAFRHNRRIPDAKDGLAMPNEIRALSLNFDRLANDIVRDEAHLEDALHEKNVLIKEIHHRVKNNLQLISSIMNMQIRAASEIETKTVLSSLQDRVRSLATIHRDLYQSQNAGMVNVGALIEDVVGNSVEVGMSKASEIDIKTEISQIYLYPDQAVPLSLLAAEALTNGIKYIGTLDGSQPWIEVSLTNEDNLCILNLSNSVGAAVDVESTGLGFELIEAFAMQLGGNIDIDKTDDSFSITVDFVPQDFVPETRNY